MPTHRHRELTIFFSVGEPSGDLHAANLIRKLRTQHPHLKAVGYGGPRMAEAGCQLHDDLTRLAVMWFARVLAHLGTFLKLLGRADRYFRHQRPDAVVLVDYPGFNWWIARRAKAHGIPVFYYGAPQIWAWARWRVRKMRRFVDHVLCKLPFEQAWFRDHGCRAQYVGHPYFDELNAQQLDHQFIAAHTAANQPWVAILPGSRTQEVKHNLHWLLEAARHIHEHVPHARFAVAAFRPSHAALARQMIEGSDLPVDAHVDVYVGRTAELIHLSTCAMAVSGSVSLELLYHAKPAVVLYWISRLAYFVQGYFRKVRYITLVNLLAADDPFAVDRAPYDPKAPGAEEVPIPEYLTSEDRSADVASHIIEWLTDETLRAERVAALTRLREQVARGGASDRAARYILGELGCDPAPPAGPPHFLDQPVTPGKTVPIAPAEPPPKKLQDNVVARSPDRGNSPTEGLHDTNHPAKPNRAP